ncbi:MAG TPA: TrkH family potassium uptake protein, partial [Rhizobiales bacterium]|nr:TrkH family potassium uptake protein [Hyphomicrobiales bacterium]
MFDLRPIFLVSGILLSSLGAAMLVPGLYDLSMNSEDWKAFAGSALVTLFIGVSLTLANWGQSADLSIKQAFILTTLVWVELVSFAALPMVFSKLDMSYTDAFFESMSGLTTTGATVITGLDGASPGVLLWRGILQWLGGIGIIVMAISVLPMLQVGGMQLFRLESSDTSEKILPRATQIAASITGIYVALSLLCALFYLIAGMNTFDALVHAMTTIATGGFSNHDASMGFFDSPAIDMIAVLFMIISSLPFALYLQAMAGRTGPLWRDSQIRLFLFFIVTFVTIMWLYQMAQEISPPGLAFQRAAFNVVSILTGTGYATTDYGLWGPFAIVFFFVIMFMGGCAGSTSCGLKTFRLHVMMEHIRTQIRLQLHPNGVFIPRYNRKPLRDDVIMSVMSFIMLFFICFVILALALNLLGLDT